MPFDWSSAVVDDPQSDRIDVPELDQQAGVPDSVQQRQGAGYGAVLGPAMSGQADALNRQNSERTQEPHVFDWTTAEVQPKEEAPPKIDWNSATNLSPSLVNTVKGFEGWDTGGWDYGQYSTGYGTRAKYPGEKISKEEAGSRLEDELSKSARNVDGAIDKSGIKLDPNQRDALISFDYNTGRGADLINTSGSPEEIRNRMLQYVHAGGKVLPALVQRRQAEATLFSGNAPSVGPDQAPQGPASTGEPTTSAFGRMAGIAKMPEATATNEQAVSRAYDEARVAKESALAALQGFKGSLQGSSAAVSQYAYAPVLHGIKSAVETLAPDTAASKYAEKLYQDFNDTFVTGTKRARADEAAQIPDTVLNQVSQAIGGMGADIGTAVVTGAAGKGLPMAAKAIGKAETAAPTIFNIVKQQIPGLTKQAGTFAIPALRSGMDAQDMAKKMGASPSDQNLAFWKAGLLTMSSAAIPMGVESKAAGMFKRFAERAAKSVPVGLGVTAATQGIDDPKQLAINAIPLVLLGAALGHNVREVPRGPIATQAFPEGGRAMPGGEVKFAPKEAPSKSKPGDLWYQGVSEKGETDWVTHDINIARGYAKRRGAGAKINVYTAEQVGKTAFEDEKGNLISPQEYAKTNWSTTLQTGAGKPTPVASFPADSIPPEFAKGAPKGEPYPAPAGLGIVPPPLPPPRTGPEPRIVPLFGVVKQAKGGKLKFKDIEADPARTWQGTANILEKSGFTALGKAVRDHVDKWRQYTGMTMSPFRKWAKGMSAKDIAKAQQEFRDYWATLDEKGVGHTDTVTKYNGSSPKAQQAIDIATRLFNQTGDIAAAKGLEVFNHETGKWRPFRKIGSGFFPRRISPYWREILNKPQNYPAEYNAIRNEIAAKGFVNQLSEVDAYIARALKSQTPDDLSPIEHARTSPLPTRVYDYGFDTMTNYFRNWSWDMARIEAFGQKKFGEDLFEKSQHLTTDTYSKGYIKNVQDLAYRKQNAGAWSSTLNGANTVATVNMLANYLSSMRNAIGGILYNAHYNGVSNSMKALTGIHKMAGEIDNAYDRGILQDNLFHVQEDVNAMQGPVRKFTDKALGWSGQKLAEDWTRAMNLVAARSFLRDAIKSNQKNPESFWTLQYRAKIQRLGGIDPEALLREGGVGPVTDRFLRQNVAAVQGGYQYDQTPLSINRPAGRTIFQFQKWGTQAADMFVKDVVNPALQAISKGAGRQETVQVPDGAGGMKSVRVPGNLLPVARFILLSTAAGLTQKELQNFIFGIEDKEASFAEILSRMKASDAGAFGDLLHKVFMANMSVGAAGIIGNYAQLLTDVTQRTRFKDPTAPPALALPKAVLGLIIDGINQGTLTGMDVDAALRNIVSGYRTGQQVATRLHDAFGGDVVALKAASARNDLSWLRGVTRRYDNSIGASRPNISFGTVSKSPLTPFDANLKEALMTGDSLRASDLLDAHLDPMTPSQKRVEMERIKQSVQGSQPIRVGGGTGAAMQANFKDWAETYLPINDQLRINDIDERYTSTAIGLRLMAPHKASEGQKIKALQRLQNKAATRAGP